MARYEQIPADSMYKRRAKPRYDEARTLLVSEHMAAADKARTAGRCADVRTEVAEIIRLDPRNTIAREMVRLCRPPNGRGGAGAPVRGAPGEAAPQRRRSTAAADAPRARRAPRSQRRAPRRPRTRPIRTR